MGCPKVVNMLMLGMKDFVLLPGNCLEVMYALPPASVDLVLSDPPYGITDCEWPKVRLR